MGGPGCFLDGKLSWGKDCVWHPSASFSVISTVLGTHLTPKHLSQGTLGCNEKKLTLTRLAKKKKKRGMSRKYSAAPYESQKPGSLIFSQLPKDSMASYLSFLVPLTLLLDQSGHPGHLYVMIHGYNRDCKCSGFQNLVMHQSHLEIFLKL